MRFPNELKAVKDRQGITIRVNRPCIICNILQGHHQGCQKIKDPLYKEHPSEIALDNHELQYKINNDGTLQELVEKVRQILITEKIIQNEIQTN